ncbi:ABC transporter permease [Marinithermus hydrothermalis]|uniref:ABC-type transporter, integral membrane subunit n=1 Tax=Marinithermus hydrothermalis (strain DSM 14884 / JCM 11576 / T1) TaxID=869210 RepID=F2NPG8_MARHT|nr:ABC transporter permease [Marinithermus hydrothermalis]AEB12249.1 ABC-type transporter, integral membrane subunit [Marinithermus hydrothermalis DSM 14884]
MRLLGPVLQALLSLGLLIGFFSLDELHARVMLAIWPEYADDIPYPGGDMLRLGLRTIELVLISSGISVLIAVPLGILATRPAYREEFAPIVSGLANAGQTVPSLAVIAIAFPVLGFGVWPTIVALVINGLLPIVRNTIAGLESVDRAQLDAGLGMGMTPRQLLWQVELPHAVPVILAGIRTSVVLNVGTAVLGGLVGAGGLGEPIVNGIQLRIPPHVWFGAVPTALLAVIADYFLGQVERVLTPAGLLLERERD